MPPLSVGDPVRFSVIWLKNATQYAAGLVPLALFIDHFNRSLYVGCKSQQFSLRGTRVVLHT
jgi:hypothetical protein